MNMQYVNYLFLWHYSNVLNPERTKLNFSLKRKPLKRSIVFCFNMTPLCSSTSRSQRDE